MTLSGAQKCAILLLVLEEPQAADMLRRMAPEEVQAVGEAMLSVAEIEPAAIEAVLDEFLSRSEGVAALDSQGRQVRAVLSAALGQPRAGQVIDRIGPPARHVRFASLAWLDPDALAALLADEHPQAIAVVLAHFAEERAAAVLDALPEAQQADIATRLATLGPVAQGEITALEAVVAKKLDSFADQRDDASLAGTDFAAAIVKKSRNRGMLLQALASVDQGLAAEIEAQQFVFADLAGLSSRDMQLVLREADTTLLAVALKGGPANVRELVFGAMSKRAASQLQDEIAERGPMKRSDVEEAQRELCRLVRRLADSGALTLPDANAAYV